MMWGMGDGSSEARAGQPSPGAPPDTVAGGAAAGAAGASAGAAGEATDAEMYGAGSGSAPAPGSPASNGEEAVRGRGYNEELGWGQDGWENEEVMEDPWQQEQGGDDGFFGGGGGDWGGGDWS